jgi:hypothetical protein
LSALPRLLLAAALVLLVGFLVGLLAALVLLVRLLAAALLLLARAGIVRLLTWILTWIVRIGHSRSPRGSAPGPQGKRAEIKRVRGGNDQFCGIIP